VGVILAGLAIMLTGWLWVDPAMSFIIGVVVLAGAGRLLREGLNVLLEAPPKHLSPQLIEREMASMDGVNGVHDLHMWSVAPGFNLLSCHLTLDDLPLSQGTRIMGHIREMLHAKYGISHATLQLECPGCESTSCPLCPLPQGGASTIDNPQL
jgi:cobalt-zinc-cadmium efflux system protein